jgi:signal transduction histidine kinase
LKFASEEKNIHFLLDLEPLFPIEGDPQLIQEIILNLVENAVKYGHAKSEVVIRTSEEKGRIRVSVKDQGEGIPADEIPRVIGKFYRGRSVRENSTGSGLGLYLAKYFVELHQGELELKSQQGKGTEVSFWLPSPV